MRMESGVAALLALVFVSCSHDHDVQEATTALSNTAPTQVDLLAPTVHRDLLDFGILQKTCALYVAVRSSALERSPCLRPRSGRQHGAMELLPRRKEGGLQGEHQRRWRNVVTGIDWPHGDAIAVANEELQQTSSH